MESADLKTQKPDGKNRQKKNLCPIVQSPNPECYFLDMSSNKISMTIYYCRNHYVKCEIYKRIDSGKRSNRK